MAASIGNITRVSSSLKTFTSLQQLQQNAIRMFREQERISSGRKLLSISDDPVTAEKITKLMQSLEGQDQILANLQHADSNLTAADSALTEISDLLIEAARIASEQAGSFSSADERASQAEIVDGIIDALMNVGNRSFRDNYLFGGQSVTTAPLSTVFGRAGLMGDYGERRTVVDRNFTSSYNIAVGEVFQLDGDVSGGYADWNVQLNLNGRLSELNGALGSGIRLGRIAVTIGAAPAVELDLAGCGTLADVKSKFDDAFGGSGLALDINPADGATLRVVNGSGSAIQISEVGLGTTAADLGLRKSAGAGVNILGDDLNRRATLTTKLSDLAPGGVALPAGVTVTIGQVTKTVTFTGATTLQDVLNRLNGTSMGIRASINADGNGIEIENLVAGTAMVIGENGGTDAETLGIKTLDRGVQLSRLNGSIGIHPVSGNDIRITGADGVAFEVDLSNAKTVGDVIDAINTASTAAGASIAASTNNGGAGFRLVDTSGGAGNIVVEAANLSPVAAELGLLKTGTPTALEGDNVGQFYQAGIFSALYRLRDGLAGDSSVEITEAGRQINELQKHVAAVMGQVGARAGAVRSRVDQTQDAVEATQILLSELQDVDFTEAVTRFQQAQTALQASLLTTSQTMNLSLLNFLS